MISLAITMIVKNEELTLERILAKLTFADEIIIVDTGSDDKTVSIAQKYTSKVFFYKWDNDFAAARNYAISKVNADYFMWLDADDVIKDEDIIKFKNLKLKIKNEDIIMLPYVLNYNNKELSFYRERIIKNKNHLFVGKVHEVIPLNGLIKYEEIQIYHKKIKPSEKERNLNIYKEILKTRKLNSRELYYYGNELLDNNYLIDAQKIFLKFIKDKNGANFNKVDACLKLHNIYILQKKPKKREEYIFKSLEFGIHSSLQIYYLIIYYYQEKEYISCELFAKLLLTYKDDPLSFNYLKDKDYYAYIYLSLCSFYLGDKQSALEYNNEALKIRPNDTLALRNKKYYI